MKSSCTCSTNGATAGSICIWGGVTKTLNAGNRTRGRRKRNAGISISPPEVDNRIGPENKGVLAIDYDICLQGLSEGHSRLELEII